MLYSCKKATELISIGREMKLRPHQRLMLWMHVLMCKFCSRFKKQVHQVDTLYKLAGNNDHDPGSDETSTLPEETKTRIKEKIKDLR